MQCIAIKAPGGPDQLTLTERPVPQPRPGEVLVKVSAAGVNRPDIVQRLGHYPPPPGASDLPGLEIAGRIVAIGNGVSENFIGEQICALVSGGGYAAFATAPIGSCLPVPIGFTDEQAAAIPETFFTVWHNVIERGALKNGESILIHGGASGIGTAAIQVAKAFGAKVAVTAGTDEKCVSCLRLGADTAINYRTQDFAELIRALPGKGVDVVLDMIGGNYLARNLKCLRPDGRLVVIATQGGGKGEADLTSVMLKRLTITGSTLRARDAEFKAALAKTVRSNLWPHFESGRMAPVLFRTFDLAAARDAHEAMEASTHFGKIVLKI